MENRQQKIVWLTCVNELRDKKQKNHKENHQYKEYLNHQPPVG